MCFTRPHDFRFFLAIPRESDVWLMINLKRFCVNDFESQNGKNHHFTLRVVGQLVGRNAMLGSIVDDRLCNSIFLQCPLYLAQMRNVVLTVLSGSPLSEWKYSDSFVAKWKFVVVHKCRANYLMDRQFRGFIHAVWDNNGFSCEYVTNMKWYNHLT